MRLVAANAARVNQEERGEGVANEESRGCNEGKFRAALSGKGWWFSRARGGEAEKWKGIMDRDGSTCHPAENYDSSFSAVAQSRFSRHF